MQTASPTSTLLGDRSPTEFLDTYWQKRPLVVRDALPDFESPLTPNELAGLACEEGVESRLILEEGGDYPWQLKHGPFEQDDFLTLPETHWTVLVQEVDRLIPEVGALLDRFRFLPDWRIDDVMVSYAPTHGTVGPAHRQLRRLPDPGPRPPPLENWHRAGRGRGDRARPRRAHSRRL